MTHIYLLKQFISEPGQYLLSLYCLLQKNVCKERTIFKSVGKHFLNRDLDQFFAATSEMCERESTKELLIVAF